MNRWIEIGNIPEAYGGNKILKTQLYKQLGDLCILTIENLSREDIEYTYGSLDDYEIVHTKKRKVPVIPYNKKPKKIRTELYYQLAGSKDNTKKLKGKSVLPNNWKELGIRSDQLIKKKNKQKGKK